MVYERAGDAGRALEVIQRARPLLEAAYGPEHPDLATLLNNTGLVLGSTGRLEEAVRTFRRGEEIATKLAGPDHLLVGLTVGNSAETLNKLGRYEEARVASERALAIWRRSGASPIYEAVALNSLGQALLGLGRPAEAAENLERARALVGDETSLYPHEIRFALARALWTWPEKRARALALAGEARAGYQRRGTAAAEVAAVDTWLRSHRN
jgi:tetratricopeptide (TPR) repeat protein